MHFKSDLYNYKNKIVLLSFNTISWSQNDDILLNLLSAERQSKILNYVHLCNRKASLYAAALTRYELGLLTCDKPQNLRFSYSDFGKPHLTDYPKIGFNISHSGNSIIFAYNQSSYDQIDIGVDIEIIQKAPLSVMNSTFHKNEVSTVYLDNQNINNRFYTIWTRKEALFKYIGTGLADNSLRDIDTTKYSIHTSPSIWSSFYRSGNNSYIFSIASTHMLSDYTVHYISSDDLSKKILSL